MNAAPASAPICGSEHCITCGDDGVPMTVVRIDAPRGLALCADADGARATVETALVEPVAPGDRLLVHAGTAIAVESAGADSIGTSARAQVPVQAGDLEVPGVVRDAVISP